MKHAIVLQAGADLDGFRNALRACLQADRHPDDVAWATADAHGLFGADAPAQPGSGPPILLPRNVSDIASLVICHTDIEKYGLLYRLIWRIQKGERHLWEIKSDPLVHRIERMAKNVRQDIYKMHAFLRFRRDGDSERFIAWWEPEHDVLRAAAQFFADRFPSFPWKILTPRGSILWDLERLSFGPAAAREDAPAADDFERGWSDYYESIFNPARVNSRAMLAQMPKKYWRNMPETQSIPALIQNASARAERMIEAEAAIPAKRNPDKAVERMADQAPRSLEALNEIIAKSPSFVPGGVRAVLGEGPLHPDIAFIGEQPGDQEDLQGRPFVGPAGQLLDRAMQEAGIARSEVYVTNAVKHFKFQQRGKRRLHQSPTTGEIKHYRWWLEKELEFVQPKLIVALGATAAQALAGKAMPVQANRGALRFGDRAGFVTVHPSYMLRLPDDDSRDTAYRAFAADLDKIKALAKAA